MRESNSALIEERSHVILNWVVKEGFSEEVLFKSGSEWPKELAMWAFEERVLQGEETVGTKSLKWIDLFKKLKEK